MAKVRLDIEGNFNNIPVDLQKMNSSLKDIGNTSTDLRGKINSAFTKNKNIVDEFGNVLVTVQGKFSSTMKSMGDTSEKAANKGKAAVVNLKTELRKATNEASSLAFQASKGLIPPEAVIEAQKRVSGLKQQFKDFRESIDAFNPEKKFTALSQVVGGFSGGLSAVVGLMGVLGVESEETQKWLLRVQGAMAFSQGLNQLLGIGTSLTNLKNVLGVTSGVMQETTQDTESLASSISTAGAQINSTSQGGIVLGKTIDKLEKSIKGKTIATELETAAIEQQNTVQIVNTEGKVISTGATKSLGIVQKETAIQTTFLTRALALMTGPIGIVVIALGLAFGALKLWLRTGVDVDELTKKLEKDQEKFADSIDATKEAFSRQNEVLQANIDLLIATNKLKVALAGGSDTAAGRAAGEKASKEELEAQRVQTELQIRQNDELIKKQQARFEEIETKLAPVREALSELLAKKLLLQQSAPLVALVAGPSDSDVENLVKFLAGQEKTAKALQDTNEGLKTQNVVLAKGQQVRETEFDASAIDKENERNRKILAARVELAHKLLEIQRGLAKSLDDLEKESLSGNPQLNSQQRIDQEKAFAVLKLKETKDQLIAQGQAEEDALAKLQGRKAQFFQLGTDQLEQLQIIRDGIEFKHTEASNELQRQAALNRLAITKESAEKDLEIFKINFEERRKLLIAQGFTEAEIQADFNHQLEKSTLDARDKQLQASVDIQKSLIDQQEILGVSEEQAQRIRTEKKLAIDLQYAKDKLTLLLEVNRISGGISDKEFQTAKAQIAELSRQLSAAHQAVAAGSKPLSWANLFGIAPEQQDAFNEAVGTMLEKTAELKDAFFAQQEESLQIELDANQKRIDAGTERLDELERQLANELELNKEGLANNLDAVKQQIAQVKAEKDRELQNQRKLQQEKRKLAEEQAIIDTISQSSALITATANIFLSESTKGLLGVITAIGAVAALFAGFLEAKGKIQAATKLEHGGWIDGPAHTAGGVTYQATAPGKGPKELEGDEFLVQKRQAKKHGSFLEKLNKGKYNEISLPELMPFISDMKIGYSTEAVERVIDRKTEISKMEIRYSGQRENVGEKVDAMHDTLKDYVDHKLNEEHRHVLQDGTQLITRNGGAHVDIIRP